MGKGALDGDRIVALNKNCQALKQEGRLADIIRSTSKSRPNNIRGGKMSVRTSVRPSVRPQKVSSISMKFGIQVEVDE